MHELPPARLLVAAPRGGTAAIAEDRSAMTRRPSESPLPLDAAPRVRHGKAVMPQAEDAAVHDAVLALRRAGIPVYRSGAQHKVGGRLLSTRQLLARAAVRGNCRTRPKTPQRRATFTGRKNDEGQPFLPFADV